MNPPLKRDAHEHSISIQLEIARQMIIKRRFDVAETIFKRALKTAEKVSGDNSALSGIILVELFYLYEDAGQNSEARQVWQRIRNILIEKSAQS